METSETSGIASAPSTLRASCWRCAAVRLCWPVNLSAVPSLINRLATSRVIGGVIQTLRLTD